MQKYVQHNHWYNNFPQILSFFVSAFDRISVHLHSTKVSVLWKKGSHLSPQKSAFWKIGVYFSKEKSVVRGRFVFWRTIIRPPFTFWRGGTGVSHYMSAQHNSGNPKTRSVRKGHLLATNSHNCPPSCPCYLLAFDPHDAPSVPVSHLI